MGSHGYGRGRHSGEMDPAAGIVVAAAGRLGVHWPGSARDDLAHDPRHPAADLRTGDAIYPAPLGSQGDVLDQSENSPAGDGALMLPHENSRPSYNDWA